MCSMHVVWSVVMCFAWWPLVKKKHKAKSSLENTVRKSFKETFWKKKWKRNLTKYSNRENIKKQFALLQYSQYNFEILHKNMGLVTCQTFIYI